MSLLILFKQQQCNDCPFTITSNNNEVKKCALCAETMLCNICYFLQNGICSNCMGECEVLENEV